MNKQQMSTLLGTNVTVVFKNGEQQTGPLHGDVARQNNGKTPLFAVGKYGAPFAVQAVADVIGGGTVAVDTKRGTVTRKASKPGTKDAKPAPRYIAAVALAPNDWNNNVGSKKGLTLPDAKALVEKTIEHSGLMKRGHHFEWRGQVCVVLNNRGNETGIEGRVRRLAKGSGQSKPVSKTAKRITDVNAKMDDAATQYKRYLAALRKTQPKIAKDVKIIDLGMGLPSLVYVPLTEDGMRVFFCTPDFSANGDYYCGWEHDGYGDGREFTRRTKPEAVATYFAKMVKAAKKEIAA